MAKQNINIGTSANDGTGDPLRDAFDKLNKNFTDLYNVHGWGVYNDSETSPATITIDDTAPTKLLIDGAGSLSETSYLPREIRGSGQLWDAATSRITPINVGDSYDIRIDMEIISKTATPTIIDLALDIGTSQDGTGGTGSMVIVKKIIETTKTTPYNISTSIPIFTLTNFIPNGGSIWLSTDTGGVTIGSRDIFIKRTSSGSI